MNKIDLKKYDRIIIGIDPGTNVMGYGLIGCMSGASGPDFIDMGVLKLSVKTDSYNKLSIIYNKVQELVENYLPNEMAIEAPFYGKNVQSMLKLGRAQGVAMAAALSRQVPIHEYEPRKVKLSITGNGASSKEQVRSMLIHILKIPLQQIPQELDASDALAIALCHFYESGKIVSSSKAKTWAEFIAQNPDRVK